MLISWKLDRKFHYAINEAVGAHRWCVENVFRWNLSIWCEEYQKALKCFAFSFHRVCLHVCVCRSNFSDFFLSFFFSIYRQKKTVIFRLLSVSLINFQAHTHMYTSIGSTWQTVWYRFDILTTWVNNKADVCAMFDHSCLSLTQTSTLYFIGTQINNYHLVVAL